MTGEPKRHPHEMTDDERREWWEACYPRTLTARLSRQLREANGERDDLRRRLDAANSVIRRQVDWEYLPAVDDMPAVWTPRDPLDRLDGSDDPVTNAEAAAIQAALDVPAADPASGDEPPVRVTKLTAEDIASAQEGLDAADRIIPVRLPAADPATQETETDR